MTDVLTARRRAVQGKRQVRRLRRQGLVPGVVYGRDTTPLAVTVESRSLVKLLHAKAREHALLTLRIEDGTPWERPVLVKAIQDHPVAGHVLHVDFQVIVLTERLRVKIPVLLKGEAVGVKQEGGILEHFLREVEVECLPTEIPPSVELDISALKIGETIHVGDLIPPKGAKITTDPTGVIASVQKPREEKVEEAAAVTEPEVIREKKEEAKPAGAEEAKEEKGAAPAPEGKKESK
ncbi:MAG: 50S ribosomal protein L25 [Candidatus Omnitrophota bacterium]|nr:50S ribosomal protein L25 [Candidatus Omnitrophota bacterium]